MPELGRRGNPQYNEATRVGWTRIHLPRGLNVLTEQEVVRTWSRLFRGEVTSQSIVKAETLLDELRPESPLRHRLGTELDELRLLSMRD
jgi:hypothetical protein